MIIQFSDDFIERHPEYFEYVSESIINRTISYVINSKTLKAVILTKWLREQVENPSENTKRIADSIRNYKNPDQQAIQVHQWMKNNMIYTGDHKQYGIWELWATAEETLIRLKGDY